MNYLIIGGGISGLYCAYSLHKKFGIVDITIIEKSNRLGGRIDTKQINGTFLEMGAGGVSSGQKNMLSLVNELNLKDKLSQGSSGRSFAVTSTVSTSEYIPNDNNIVPTIYKINAVVNINDTDFYTIIHKLTEKLKDPNFFEMALTHNLYMLIEKYYGVEKADKLMYQFGYRDDFFEQNSVEALKMFKKEFSPDAKFHKINGGMTQIIDRLTDYLNNQNITIKLNSQCVDIQKNNDTYECLLSDNNKLMAKNIIFAIPKMDLLKIKYLDIIFTKINSVIHKPLIRIYAFFPLLNGKVWFDDIKMTLTTKTLMNQIIPIDKKKGILMIYCDSINAKSWHYFHTKNILKRELLFHLTKLFSDLIIPEPTEIHVSYHDSATHIWKPSINPTKMYEEIVQPIVNEKIFIVGEAYSLNQQWAEGAIQSVDHLMKRLS